MRKMMLVMTSWWVYRWMSRRQTHRALIRLSVKREYLLVEYNILSKMQFRISKRQSSKPPVPISQSTWRHFCFRWRPDASLVIFRTFLWKDDYAIHTNHRFWFLPFLFNDWQHEQPGSSTLYAELSNWHGWKHSEKIEPEYRNYEKKFVIWKMSAIWLILFSP